MPAANAIPRRALLRRALPLAVLIAGLGLVFALGLDDYLSIEALRVHRAELSAFVAGHWLRAALIYVCLYAAITAFSVPGGAVTTIAGGLLLGTLPATALTVLGATVGACIVFLVAKSSLGDPLRRRAGPWFARMEQGFAENAFSYLLVLRLVPLFPFFVVNIVPAFLGVPFRTYALTTLIGIIPGTFVFASVGAGIGSVLEAGGAITPESALTSEVILALVGLSLLALVPVAYRMARRRRH